MPASTRKQQRFMYAELARKGAGKATKTGMSIKQIREYTHLKSGAKHSPGMPTHKDLVRCGKRFYGK